MRSRSHEFLERFDADPAACSDTVKKWLRGPYLARMAVLVEPLIATGDPLMRLTLVRHADARDKEEARLVRAFLDGADPVRDRAALDAVRKIGNQSLVAAVDRINEAAAAAARKRAADLLNRPSVPKAVKNGVSGQLPAEVSRASRKPGK
jgi:hypothetical protein